MGQIIPFDQVTRGDIATLQDMFKPDTSLVVSGGFPVLSIKGSKFALVKGGEREVIRNPQTGDIASSIDVVIVGYNPQVSKIYYEGKYVDGTNDKPDCYSNDGISPAADAESPQSKKCATCPHNAWGSRITDDGKKAKACADSRRIAVAAPDQINEPMLLRVPPTSMKPLGEYQKMLANRNLAVQTVVTKLSFDEDSSSPLLVFKPVGLCDADMLAEVVEINKDDIVKQITGQAPVAEPVEVLDETPAKQSKQPVVEDDEDEDAAAAEAAKKKAELAAKKKAEAAAKKKAEAEAEAAAEVEAKKTAAKKKAAPKDDGDDALFAALDDVLSL